MAIAVRSIETDWEGPVGTGSGKFTQGSSGALDGLDVTWAARTVRPDGKTSPEELAAAAHSSCFAMALGLRLDAHQTPAQRMWVSATVALEEVNGVPTITTSKLDVRALIPGMDSDQFAAVIDEAAQLCPVSRLFAGAEVSVEARLETV